MLPTSARLLRLLALLQVDASDKQLQERFAWDSDLLHFAIINICNEFLNAKKRGVKRLRSIESRDNREAIDVERTLGFRSSDYEGDATLALLEIDLG